MKREGRQHGMVRINTYLPPEFNPSPNTAKKIINPLGSTPPTSGAYTKAPTKPTGHSKFTGKCRKARCQSCHAAPVTKSKDKVKGAYKLRSGNVLLNHRLASWRVVDSGAGMVAPPAGFRGISASEILGQLSASYQWHEGDGHVNNCVEYYGGFSDHYMEKKEEEEEENYWSADHDLTAESFAATGIVVENEAGSTSGGDDDGREVDGGGELDFLMVGMGLENSDGEDWLVVEEM